jgi:hypothetical protein
MPSGIDFPPKATFQQSPHAALKIQEGSNPLTVSKASSHTWRWVTKISPSGIEYSYAEPERPVPRINDEYLGSAIYLYKNRRDAEQSSYFGASGFLVGHVDMQSTIMHIYAATNAHVIRDGNSVIRINKRFGGYDVLEIPSTAWLFHPEGDDLAICPTVLSPQYDFKFIASNGCVDEDKLRNFNIGVGDEVFMVGRFTRHSGEKKNLPIARFGNIAMMPSEEIQNGLGNKRPHFLVEVRSVSGFSGSPVFVYDFPGSVSKGQRNFVRPDLLLGIDCGHLPEREQQLSAGIAAVVPAWRLLELLEHPAMKKVRDDREAQMKKEAEKQGTIVGDAATPTIL